MFFKKLMACLAMWGILGMITLPGIAQEPTVFLDPPGLRPVKDPSTIIPADYLYINRPSALPDYRDPFGKLSHGWVEEVIKTRRFFSNRSARVYIRSRDLVESSTFNPSGPLGEMRVWPLGTAAVIEIYEGDGAMTKNAIPGEIAVMVKTDNQATDSSSFFYPMEWSYARFTQDGVPSLAPDEARECHRCHSIAFHLTGDLIFTRFP
jgi:hypothetical protein